MDGSKMLLNKPATRYRRFFYNAMCYYSYDDDATYNRDTSLFFIYTKLLHLIIAIIMVFESPTAPTVHEEVWGFSTAFVHLVMFLALSVAINRRWLINRYFLASESQPGTRALFLLVIDIMVWASTILCFAVFVWGYIALFLIKKDGVPPFITGIYVSVGVVTLGSFGISLVYFTDV